MFILGEHLDLRDAFVHFYRHTQRHIYSSYTHTRTHMYMIVYVCVCVASRFSTGGPRTLWGLQPGELVAGHSFAAEILAAGNQVLGNSVA